MGTIFRRLATRFLPFARKNRFLAALYYSIFSERFSREQFAVLHGQKRFKETNGPGNGSSTILRRNIHRLEKGLIMRPRREVFALAYIEETITAYKRAVEEAQSGTHTEILWAHDVLNAYFNACGPHKIINRLRNDYSSIPHLQESCRADRANTFSPYMRNLEKPLSIEYLDLLKLAKHRRSVRWFKSKPVPRRLIEKAVLVASLSPSACNRQPFEFRFFDDPDLIPKIASLPGGTVGFHDNFPFICVLVGNLAHYYDEKDRHLIYIDGGLAAMSLILALETLGLSSCCINWPDIEKYELQAEQILGLKQYERPIMFLAIGYPDAKGMVPYSEKKSISQLCRWNYMG
ncbi:nitroreductase family protein [Verrucomicrobia bacterium]|nr:nitroreductase family protein [Verrucomicrobiota bacterium]